MYLLLESKVAFIVMVDKDVRSASNLPKPSVMSSVNVILVVFTSFIMTN